MIARKFSVFCFPLSCGLYIYIERERIKEKIKNFWWKIRKLRKKEKNKKSINSLSVFPRVSLLQTLTPRIEILTIAISLPHPISGLIPNSIRSPYLPSSFSFVLLFFSPSSLGSARRGSRPERPDRLASRGEVRRVGSLLNRV